MAKAERIRGKNDKGARVYTLVGKTGLRMKVTNYGAAVMSLEVPDARGCLTDVALGFDTPREYFGDQPFFGATIGCCAGRIAGGTFELGGKQYQIPCNENGVNLLHSGKKGFHRVLWEAETHDRERICFVYKSPDGEGGFPGTVEVRVGMSLTEENGLRLEYEAHTDADTLVNLTNHSYFNLNGGGSIERHCLLIEADYFTPVDERMIPTGEITEVGGTALDFRQIHMIGEKLGSAEKQLELCGGYDHNYVLRGEGFRRAARLESPESRLAMEVFTDMPGMQFYTANALAGMEGKRGARYDARSACCFETQLFPDSIHHDNFPSYILRAGEIYRSATEYRFFIG